MDDAIAFAGMARALAEVHGVRPTLERVVAHAIAAVPCDWAAAVAAHEISAKPARLAATTDPEVMGLVARIAGAAGTSPGWQAFETGTMVYCPDLTTETRFGGYPAAMVELTPIRAVLSFGLHLNGEALGVLSLYARDIDAFDSAARRRAAVLADHAGIAIDAATNVDRVDQLQVALLTNRTIATAVGVLVERLSATPDEAFDLLRVLSQHTNRKLSDIAEHLVRTGELPVVDERPAHFAT
jgi:GAF domain-containing protein